MLKVYSWNLSPLKNGQWQHLLHLIPIYRQTRARSCRSDPAAAQIVGASLLLQQVLEQNGIPVSEQDFTTNPQGKPALRIQRDLHFSISHEDNWVVCALSDQPVGIDITLPRCTEVLANRWFHPQEREYLSRSPSPHRDRQRLWAAKEAYLKAIGVGLTVPLSSFCFQWDDQTLFLSDEWFFHETMLEKNYLCVCGKEPIHVPLNIVQMGIDHGMPG